MKRRLLNILLSLPLCSPLPATLAAASEEPIKPLPARSPQDPLRVALGKRLFFEPRLSANGRVSCASCHNLARGGADQRPRSIGFAGKLTTVNAPTVLNAALNFVQFWDGRALTLESQVDMVIQNPIEMGSTWKGVLAMLEADSALRAAFAQAYPDGISKPNVQNAIASFERTLVTADSRFDRYLRGERGAINDAEKAGYAKFKRYGCVACHQGVNVGGNMFQKFGVMGDYFAHRGHISEADLGRFQVTADPKDKYVFKVPSLRNVARTAPYFHDGSAPTLEAAVEVMFRFQLGRVPSAADTADIIRFLNTLTSDPPPVP